MTVKNEETEAEEVMVTECPLFKEERGREHLKRDEKGWAVDWEGRRVEDQIDWR